MKLKIFFDTFLLLSIIFLIGCEKKSVVSPQENYKSAYGLALCIAMGVKVDSFEKDPFNNQWGMQGITTIEERDEHVTRLGILGFKMMPMRFDIPADFKPHPVNYSIHEIASNCRETYAKFIRIPF
jgi:hypothetical protein